MSDQEAYVKSPQDFVNMLKRRKLAVALPAFFVFAISVMLAFGIPATYESEAIILIEQQEIPMDLVRSTITSFAAQQVQVISQRVLTIKNISGIVEKFKLYQQEDPKSRLPNTELAEEFRENMSLDLVH